MPDASHNSRLETVGRLTSGIAHDFANILTLISGYTELLLDRCRQAGGACRELEEIRRASTRGATLVGQLLQFAGAHARDPQAIPLNTLVSDVERMLRPILGETIEVRLNLAPSLGYVFADPVEMDQVLMNLLLNARDAMPAGGAIVIETGESRLDGAAAALYEMAAGPCVMLRIADNGPGIEPETMAHLFEPFFTTKPKGKGAGLGLSTVRQIVRRTGGAVWASSAPGSGATFHICLPRLAAASEVSGVKPAAPLAAHGSETVLIVEDEPGVRRLLTEMLRMRGYEVLEAADGEEAFAMFQARRAGIQLVVTDVVMPRTGGAELAARLLALRPDVELLFISGYPEDALPGACPMPANPRFLRKPLTAEALASAVREALDSRSRPFDPQ